MPKIIFIGAGSTVFARHPLGDIPNYCELADGSLADEPVGAHGGWLPVALREPVRRQAAG